jgi:hypothetical protein
VKLQQYLNGVLDDTGDPEMDGDTQPARPHARARQGGMEAAPWREIHSRTSLQGHRCRFFLVGKVAHGSLKG